MSRKILGVPVRALCVALAVALFCQPLAYADPGCGCCDAGCRRQHCPPCWLYIMEGPPKIKFHCGCPAPICPPSCDTPNWGYYQPCWRPWPWPPTYAHCPVPPPAAFIPPTPPPFAQAGQNGMGMGAPNLEPQGRPGINPNQRMPSPRKLGSDDNGGN